MKKNTKQNEAIHAVPAETIADLTLDALERESLMRADAEHKLAHMTVQMEHLKWELEGVRHTQRLAALQAEAFAANKAFLAAANKIETRLNINLKDYAITPETGGLVLVGSEESP